jgi:hypothetical protein
MAPEAVEQLDRFICGLLTSYGDAIGGGSDVTPRYLRW